MNLLGLLFLQYKDGKGLSFASKWMDKHGRMFLGKPQDKGMDWVREDLQRSYYWITADRVLPTEAKALREWEEQSMFVAWFRNFEAAAAAKTVSLASMVLVLALVAMGGAIDGTAAAGSAVSGKWGQLFADDADGSDTLAWCRDAQARAAANTLSPAEAMELVADPRFAQCDALLEANP